MKRGHASLMKVNCRPAQCGNRRPFREVRRTPCRYWVIPLSVATNHTIAKQPCVGLRPVCSKAGPVDPQPLATPDNTPPVPVTTAKRQKSRKADKVFNHVHWLFFSRGLVARQASPFPQLNRGPPPCPNRAHKKRGPCWEAPPARFVSFLRYPFPSTLGIASATATPRFACFPIPSGE